MLLNEKKKKSQEQQQRRKWSQRNKSKQTRKVENLQKEKSDVPGTWTIASIVSQYKDEDVKVLIHLNY